MVRGDYMKLYFENSKGERRLIAEVKRSEDIFKEINKFCEDRNFKILYTRMWVNKDGLMVYDVGSHTEFFYLDDN